MLVDSYWYYARQNLFFLSHWIKNENLLSISIRILIISYFNSCPNFTCSTILNISNRNTKRFVMKSQSCRFLFIGSVNFYIMSVNSDFRSLEVHQSAHCSQTKCVWQVSFVIERGYFYSQCPALLPCSNTQLFNINAATVLEKMLDFWKKIYKNLWTIAFSSNRFKSIAKADFLFSSKLGDAKGGSSTLKTIFPSEGLTSLGLSKEQETWASALVFPILATQVPNSCPNSIEHFRISR